MHALVAHHIVCPLLWRADSCLICVWLLANSSLVSGCPMPIITKPLVHQMTFNLVTGLLLSFLVRSANCTDWPGLVT